MTGAIRKDEPERASPAAIARWNAAVTEAYQTAEQHRRPGGAPDALRRTLGDFGNVNDTSLYAIRESQQYRELQANYMEYPLCRGCNMRRPDIA